MVHIRLRALAPVLLAAGVFALMPPPVSLAAGPVLGSRTLRQGMRGADVRSLQRELTHAGFRIRASGIFGPVTLRQVESFQRQFELPVNGVVDATVVHELRLILYSSAGSDANAQFGQRPLVQGMRGADVRVLQRDLTTTGYPTPVTGLFGPATKRSVQYFQQDNDIPSTGVVSYNDTLALRQLVAVVRVGGHNSGLGSGAPVPAAPAAPPSLGASGTATITGNGTATAPAAAPPAVRQVIAAANQIIDRPYVYGGGHGSWYSYGYDCSGAVSYALHGAGLLASPEDSTSLESYGASGPGTWITIYANASHAFMVVAGRAFDTADFGGPNIPSGSGPRWRSNPTGNLSDGARYVVRHPPGL